MATANFNIALMSIPAYYVLALVPHVYATTLSTNGDMSKYDNRNPHGSENAERIKKALSKSNYAAWERCRRCHQNSLENLPLFVAAVFAGLMAERSAGTGSVGLNNFVMGWMGARIVYTLNYLMTESAAWSHLRSVSYMVGVGWAFKVLGQSAYAVGGA